MSFESIFKEAPEITATAPGRINLIGEHIDYSDGFVLPFAISLRTTVSMRRRNDSKIRIASEQKREQIFETTIEDLGPGKSGGWELYPLGVIWTLGIKSGLDIYIDGRVPLGAGLSSSAALECSVATALNKLFNLNLDLKELALLTQKAENDYVGMPCGIMDQSISLMGKAGHALLLDCRDLSTQLVPLDLAAENLELLIIDTQAHHALVDGGYAERRGNCESAAAKLGASMRDLTEDQLQAGITKLTEVEFIRTRHAITEIQRVLDCVDALKVKDFEKVGRLLNESHRSLRDDYQVSCPELDLAVETSQKIGALGARMVGGGFGGSAIALLKKEDLDSAMKEISAAFKEQGFKLPRFFSSLPSDGAHLIDGQN